MKTLLWFIFSAHWKKQQVQRHILYLFLEHSLNSILLKPFEECDSLLLSHHRKMTMTLCRKWNSFISSYSLQTSRFSLWIIRPLFHTFTVCKFERFSLFYTIYINFIIHSYGRSYVLTREKRYLSYNDAHVELRRVLHILSLGPSWHCFLTRFSKTVLVMRMPYVVVWVCRMAGRQHSFKLTMSTQ